MKKTRVSLSKFLMATVSLAASVAYAATIHVPADQPTIQAGINVASNGDVVLVAPGTYPETINFMGKRITVRSANGPKVTIIDGATVGGPVVRFVTAETAASVLRGFTIQGGSLCCSYEGGGVEISNASPSVIGNVIQNNVGAGNGGGINIYFGSPLVQRNLIKGNSVAFSGGTEGGGVDILGSSTAQILNNVITGNFGVGFGGGIGMNGGATSFIFDNQIVGNSAQSEGGGLWLANDSSEMIVQNLIIKNTAPSGSGIYSLIPSSSPGYMVLNNTIANNSSAGDAAFVADGFNSNAQIINNVIVALPGQTALLCNPIYTDGPPIVQFNDAYSKGGTGYGGMCAGFSGSNGNISTNPGLVNYRPVAGSPVIDVGTNSAPGLPSLDLAGKPRIVDGIDSDTDAIIDMGAFEFQ